MAVVEQQDIVYRDAPAPNAPRPDLLPQAPLTDRVLTAQSDGRTYAFSTDPTKLMRFSDATSNGHRIHYDWPYTTGVEGSPGLVVHGPLMTLALAEVARLTRPSPAPYRIEHRSHGPLYCGQRAHVTMDMRDDSSVTLRLASVEDPTHTSLTISPVTEGD